MQKSVSILVLIIALLTNQNNAMSLATTHASSSANQLLRTFILHHTGKIAVGLGVAGMVAGWRYKLCARECETIRQNRELKVYESGLKIACGKVLFQKAQHKAQKRRLLDLVEPRINSLMLELGPVLSKIAPAVRLVNDVRWSRDILKRSKVTELSQLHQSQIDAALTALEMIPSKRENEVESFRTTYSDLLKAVMPICNDCIMPKLCEVVNRLSETGERLDSHSNGFSAAEEFVEQVAEELRWANSL